MTTELLPKLTTAPAKKKRSVTPELWDKIEQAWAHGKVATFDDLSEEFGVPRNQIENRLRERKIRRGQAIEEYNRKVEEELAAKAAAAAKLLADRVEETREEHYKYAKAIATLTWEEVAMARRDKRPMASTAMNLKALETAMKTLKTAREERYAILGLDAEVDIDDEGLPELMVNELTQEQMEDMRNKDTAPDDDDDVVILDESVPTDVTPEPELEPDEEDDGEEV